MQQKKRLLYFALALVLIVAPAVFALDRATLDIDPAYANETQATTYTAAAIETIDSYYYNVSPVQPCHLTDMFAAVICGSETSMQAGAAAELQRNLDIAAEELNANPTRFFATYETAEEIAVAIAEYLVAMGITTIDDEPLQYKIIVSSKNVRYGPETDYDRKGSFAHGTIVTFLGRSGDWIRITDGETTGWCRDILLAPHEGEELELLAAIELPVAAVAVAPITTATATVSTSSFSPTTTDPIDHTEDDLFLLALTIQMEAGSNWLSDQHQLLVGNVVLNRVAHPNYPSTIFAVIHQPGQYPWAARGARPAISDRAFANAQRLLNGERFAPANVVFQAQFPQGNGVFLSIFDATLGTTTYFSYL